ncbi:MAG: isoprenylcysteine carboxylmethyltransferase family protein [Candidatus Hodarchaeota archaeon]
MSEDLLFRILLILLFGIFASIRIFYRTRSSAPAQKGAKQREGIKKIGGWAGIVLSFGIIGMLISVILYLLAPAWFLWSQLPLPPVIRAIGVLTLISSLPILIWTHRTLGKYYAAVLELKEKHTLITSGPYSRIRHPMYTVFIIFTISLALISANLFVIVFSIFVIIPFPSIAKQEEQMLLGLFGDEYRDYMRQTNRFFPLKHRQKENKEPK